MMNAKISVIIPTYNRAQMVVDCVQSVLATSYDPLEIIVVDDASPDDTKSRLESTFGGDSRVKTIHNEKNSFQAVSRNRGAKIAASDYLFFLDDDNLVDKNIFTELLAAFERHPHAALIAPMAIHQRKGAKNLIWSLGSDFNRWTSQPHDRQPNLPLEQLDDTLVDFPTTYYPNGFMVTSQAFAEVHGFDETFKQTFEESDFGWRLMERGYEAFVCTKARTNHYGYIEPGCSSELRQLGIEKPFRTYCLARNRIRFARRHFNFLQTLSICLVFAPLSAAYYSAVAIRNRRFDIALAYCRGTLAGLFSQQ